MRCVFTLFFGAVSLALLSCTPTAGPSDSTSVPPIVEAASPDLGAIAGKTRVVDLTVLVSETLPAHWGANPPFARWTNNWFDTSKNQFGTPAAPSVGPYYSQRYVIDEHTGTQTDFPAHFVPPPNSDLPNAGPMGAVTGDKYPLGRMMGPAVVINVTDIRDAAKPGFSAPITLDRIKEWEAKNGTIQAGEVVLFYSGYSDAYYKPFPEGSRLTMDPVVLKTQPCWPSPTPEVMPYLHGKGVWHLGTDGPSMGPCENGQPTHLAGLQLGMSWEELLIKLGELPARGAYYVALPLRVVDQSGSPSRAVAFVPNE